MKKVIAGILFFVIVFLFSFISNFPMESMVNNVLFREGKKVGITIDYDSGEFSPGRVELEHIIIMRQGSHLMNLDSITANIGIGKINLECQKEKGILKADIESDKAKLELKDFHIVTEGTKFFRKIALTGELVNQSKKKITTGRIRVNLTEPIQMGMPVSDMVAVTDIKAGPESVELDVIDLQGTDIRGNGKITIEVHKKDFNSSKINGTLKLRTAQMPMTVAVSGTIGNIQVIPQTGN